ncbi:hypothetical protein [Sporolactobacillus inulinus]|uniref:Uncharacterized protein n=1 Tax=Sporolactobacillus inulinus TaxID=2078 RepID=A0A4Y3T161_9BACL|nr:hypothetical protein [Sporolactobacillus inulinus]GAY77364.1 hypothetical protein NBRC111894_2918 [Sporolactobacillus inulinus]GEB75802.1 hypothetical protein SIN01_01470 [Sporolactobacillus inulinus]
MAIVLFVWLMLAARHYKPVIPDLSGHHVWISYLINFEEKPGKKARGR